VRKKILIADDDQSVAECLEILLGLSGYEVFCGLRWTGGGDEGAEGRAGPDSVDMIMPKLSGFDACKIIKNDPVLQKIHVIALTSLPQMGDVEKVYAAGADDYMHKPFDNGRLLEKVKKCLEG